MTIIALPPTAHVPIVCPDWCTVTYEEHLEDLPRLDGYVVHWSDLTQPVHLGAGTFPDGTPTPDDPPSIRIDGMVGGGMTIDAAEVLARQLLALVAEARS